MASYPIPGYLEHPADLAGNLIAGFQAGARVSEEGSRLAAESQRMGIEMAERQQQLQAEQARQSQQLQMTRAYHEAQIGLRRAALDQTQQKIQLATSQTANKLAEQQAYRQRFGQLTSGPNAMEPGAASRQAMLEHPGMFSSAAGLAQAAKPPPGRPVWHPADPSTGAPGYFETSQGTLHMATRNADPGKLSATALLHALQNKEKGIQGDIANIEGVVKKTTKEQKDFVASKKQELQGVRKDIEDMLAKAKSANSGTPAKALPAKKSDLVTGETYQTKHGPATWNGTKFNPVAVPAFTEEEDTDAASE